MIFQSIQIVRDRRWELAKTVCSNSTGTREPEGGFQLGSLRMDFELISHSRSRLAAFGGNQRATGRGVSCRHQRHWMLHVSKMRTHPPYSQAVRSCHEGLLGRFLLKPHKQKTRERQQYFTGIAKRQAPSGREGAEPPQDHFSPTPSSAVTHLLLPNMNQGCSGPEQLLGQEVGL